MLITVPTTCKIAKLLAIYKVFIRCFEVYLLANLRISVPTRDNYVLAFDKSRTWCDILARERQHGTCLISIKFDVTNLKVSELR